MYIYILNYKMFSWDFFPHYILRNAMFVHLSILVERIIIYNQPYVFKAFILIVPFCFSLSYLYYSFCLGFLSSSFIFSFVSFTKGTPRIPVPGSQVLYFWLLPGKPVAQKKLSRESSPCQGSL